ncbi:putative nucleotide-binding protein with TIR-like domain [Archangium gephyra]|uniref:Nucleotide-binding protein with TIR-like domain n=1 Tax=Archangium gephyra TaxID=48 RepID=A0ABX9K663_9BACT|nr:TIR domain-containing protein [Archangium gephyra]REG34317.1 putative nucleotide-binding protein with TIR-like domain [Archangium gephyra]
MKSGQRRASKQVSSREVKGAKKASAGPPSRVYVSQNDIPSCSLEQALRIARAIADDYALQPASPLRVASALGVQPDSGSFRQICGAAIAYGLTKGGAYSQEIGLEQLGQRIVRPLDEADGLSARREALLRPRVIGDFLRKYDGSKLPREEIAKNVLHDMGVPLERTAKTFELIVEGARATGLIQQINGTPYIELAGVAARSQMTASDAQPPPTAQPVPSAEPAGVIPKFDAADVRPVAPIDPEATSEHLSRKRRVFIAHGKNRAFIEPLKKLLGFGELEAVVATERETVSVPVPDKVMKDMRNCGAAIIHVEDEVRHKDAEGVERVELNPNVLIEIGVARALYDYRFILLVKSGIELPSNLQGLYQVRYVGDRLDGDVTLKLMEAILDIKNHPLPVVDGASQENGTGE